MYEQIETPIYHMGKCIGSLVLDNNFICEVVIDGQNEPPKEDITIYIQKKRRLCNG